MRGLRCRIRRPRAGAGSSTRRRAGFVRGRRPRRLARCPVRFEGFEAVTLSTAAGTTEGLRAMPRSPWKPPFHGSDASPVALRAPDSSRLVKHRTALPGFNRNGAVRPRNRAFVSGVCLDRAGALSRQAEENDETRATRIARAARSHEASVARRGAAFNHGSPRKSFPEQTPSGARRTRAGPGAGQGTPRPSACPIRCRRR